MASDAYGVTFCGVVMDDSTLDTSGVRWVKSSLEGWDSPPVRISDSDNTGRHGGYGPSRLYGARLLTLNGLAHCPDMATAFAVRDRLHTMPGMSGSGVLVVHESVDKSVTVMLGDAIKVSMPVPLARPYVRFQIPLVAHDPFKRGASHTTPIAPGPVTAANAGTAPADMRVTLTTAGTVILSAGGVTLRTGALPAGAVIDTGATTVKDSTGADLFTLVSLPPLWPAIPAGGGTVSQLGTAQLSIAHNDTYA